MLLFRSENFFRQSSTPFIIKQSLEYEYDSWKERLKLITIQNCISIWMIFFSYRSLQKISKAFVFLAYRISISIWIYLILFRQHRIAIKKSNLYSAQSIKTEFLSNILLTQTKLKHNLNKSLSKKSTAPQFDICKRETK